MYSNIDLDDIQGYRPKNLVWSCNCNGTKKDIFITMHSVKVDGEGKCILCGHYAYKIEKHILNAKRSVLHRVFKK